MSVKQLTFTARDAELITHAFQCLKEKPNIDYDLMARNAGFKGAKSARDSWGRLYDKILGGQTIDTASGEPATPKKKGTPGKRKAASADDNCDNTEASPLKRKKAAPSKAKGKKKPAAAVEEEDNEDAAAAAVEAEVDEQED